jgi:hypothetical protein
MSDGLDTFSKCGSNMTGEASLENFPKRCSGYDSSSFAQDQRRLVD